MRVLTVRTTLERASSRMVATRSNSSGGALGWFMSHVKPLLVMEAERAGHNSRRAHCMVPLNSLPKLLTNLRGVQAG